MVRALCCDKMGLKKGPWTAEEDQVLVAHIEKHGHGNWRALPKQAGLLRCGKSCRLRWMNYLRPGIKRGSFTKEEEETIITLHEKLGNRWSAIAERLPGRTDNEIKNVWHTHLKKRLNPSLIVHESKKKRMRYDDKSKTASKAKRSELVTDAAMNTTDAGDSRFMSASPAQSCSEFSCTTDLSWLSGETSTDLLGAQEGCFTSEEFPAIDESFWTETLYADASRPNPVLETLSSFSSSGSDDMAFWLDAFMESGGLHDLPHF